MNIISTPEGSCHASHAVRGRVRYCDGKNRKPPDASADNPAQEAELTHKLRDPSHLRGLGEHPGLRTVSEKKKKSAPTDGVIFLKKQVVLTPPQPNRSGPRRDPLRWRNGIAFRRGKGRHIPGQVVFGCEGPRCKPVRRPDIATKIRDLVCGIYPGRISRQPKHPLRLH